MGELEKELREMVEIFNFYNIPEEKQKRLITSGVYFEFNRIDKVRLNCFRFAKLLKLCQKMELEFDANKMLQDLNNREDNKYEALVKLFLEIEDQEKNKELIKKKAQN